MARKPLPVEVLSHIFEEIQDIYDLCSTSLTSSAFRDEAQRVLFRNPGPMIIGHDVLPRSKFLDAIISSPHRLGPAVRSFELVLPNWHLSPRRHKISIVEKLHNALLSMVNLKTLSIWAPSNERPPDPPGPLPHILRGCSFQLITFTWGHVEGDELLLLQEFLPHQRRLKELAFPRYISDDEFCASALTIKLKVNLESLWCPVSMASTRFGHPDSRKGSLKFLRWSRAGDSSQLKPNRSLNSVLLLHSDIDPIGAKFDGPLVCLAPNFINVTFLMMHTERLQATYMTKYFETLAIMPGLRVLVFSLQYGVPANRDNEAEEVAKGMFASCRALECMDIRSEMPKISFTRRYIRSTECGSKVVCRLLSEDDEEYSWGERHRFI